MRIQMGMATLAVLAAAAARADSLPLPFYLIYLAGPGGSLQYTDADHTLAQLGGSIGALTRYPSPSVHSTITSQLAGISSADTEIQYYFSVTAPANADPSVAVPVDITALLSYAWAAPASVPEANVEYSWSALAEIGAQSYADDGSLYQTANTDIGCATGGGEVSCDNPQGPLANYAEWVTLTLDVFPGVANMWRGEGGRRHRGGIRRLDTDGARLGEWPGGLVIIVFSPCKLRKCTSPGGSSRTGLSGGSIPAFFARRPRPAGACFRLSFHRLM